MHTKGICSPAIGVQLPSVGPSLHQECQGAGDCAGMGISLGMTTSPPNVKHGHNWLSV